MNREAWLEDESASESPAVPLDRLLSSRGIPPTDDAGVELKCVETGVACTGGESRAQDHRNGHVLPRSAPGHPRSVADWNPSPTAITLAASPLVVDRTAILPGEQKWWRHQNTCMRAASWWRAYMHDDACETMSPCFPQRPRGLSYTSPVSIRMNKPCGTQPSHANIMPKCMQSSPKVAANMHWP